MGPKRSINGWVELHMISKILDVKEEAPKILPRDLPIDMINQ